MLEKVPLMYEAYNPSGYKTKPSSSVSLAMLNCLMVALVISLKLEMPRGTLCVSKALWVKV